jgi:hypothetical protein
MSRNFIARLYIACLILLLFQTPALCKVTITVEQDGTGDYTSIAEAMNNLPRNGGTILIGPGVYTDLLYIDCKVTILSTDGPETTILDGEGSHRIMVFLRPEERPGKKKLTGPRASVTGFTFRNGYANMGAALRIGHGSKVTVRNCVFHDNYSTWDAGGFLVYDPKTYLLIEDCSFTDNFAHKNGPGGVALFDARAEVNRCTFVRNTTVIGGAGLAAHYASIDVTDCLFQDNVSSDISGALYYYESSGKIRGNTFVGNSSPGSNAATIFIQESYDVEVTENIIVGDESGYGLWVHYCTIDHSCNLFWDNELGDIKEDISPDPTEIFEDPLFCDPAAGDFSIAYESPAAPENNDCKVLFGAFEPACHSGSSATELALSRAAAPPQPLTLHQNHPNPFNPSTRIEYYLPSEVHVTIDVYDVQGRLVSRLVDGIRQRGEHSVEWNGRNNLDRPVRTGVYFCRIKIGSEILTRKMLLLR